jgi:hypothetical protein
MVETSASEFWNERIKFDPLISPSQVYVTREKNETKSHFNKRLREHMSRRIMRNHNLLAKALEESFTHKNRREEALSLVHLIRKTVQKVSGSILEKDIRSIPKLIPTADMLSRLGKLPDTGIKEFKSIFQESEWNIIKSSSLYTQEEKLKVLVKQSISFDQVGPFLDRLDEIRQEIRKDPLSSVIVSSKKKRLMFASWWKKNQTRDLPMNPLKEVHRHINEENVMDAFSPFTILVAGHIPLSEEGLTRVKFDTAQKVWYWDEHPGTKELDPKELNTSGREFISYLNM